MISVLLTITTKTICKSLYLVRDYSFSHFFTWIGRKNIKLLFLNPETYFKNIIQHTSCLFLGLGLVDMNQDPEQEDAADFSVGTLENLQEEGR